MDAIWRGVCPIIASREEGMVQKTQAAQAKANKTSQNVQSFYVFPRIQNQEWRELVTSEDIIAQVCDVTRFLDDHPGGDDVLLTAAGRDSTEEFEDAGHSRTAREQIQCYCSGEIDPSPAIPELGIVIKEQASGFTLEFVSKALQS